MVLKLTKSFVFVLLLVFYSPFLFYKITLPAAQDLPRQMQNGKDILQGNLDVITKNVYSYIEPDQPFANHHWLYGVFAYILNQTVGWNGMTIFKVIVLLLIVSILFWIAMRRNDFWLVAFFAVPTILILTSRTALRPEIFSYLFVVVFLYFLLDLQENPQHKRIFWLIPIQLLWVNLHLFFGVGIFMAAGFLFEKIVLNFKNLKDHVVIIKKLSIILALLLAVIFINPYGLGGAIFSFQVNSSQDFPVSSAEINSLPNVLKAEPGFNNLSAMLFFPLSYLLALSFITALMFRWIKKKPLFANNFIFYFLASLGSGLVSFFVIRALPFFGLFFLLAVSANLNDIFLTVKEWLERKLFPKIKNGIGIVCIVSLVIIISCLGLFLNGRIIAERGLGLDRWSESSARFFQEQGLRGPIFNDTDVGSYLIGSLYPKERVFADNRFGDAYSASFFRDIYLPMIRDEDKWHEGLEKYGFNVLFFYHYDAVNGIRDFLYRRIHDPAWAWVYADRFTMILVKSSPENKEVIDNFIITDENLEERLQLLSSSENGYEKLAAADIFNLVGRFDLSMPLYLKTVSLWPHLGKVWMVLGRTELTKSDQKNSNPYLAAVFLERAVQEGWKTWETYSYLALAYFRTGQIERAKAAVYEELRIDPGNADGEKWLGILAEQGK